MTTTTKPAPAKAPRAVATKTFSPAPARKLAAARKAISEELAALATQVSAKEAECTRLHQAVASDENAQSASHAKADASLAPALAAGQKELETLYQHSDKLSATLGELDGKMPTVAEEALRAMYPTAVQTQTELARLDEIEARLQAERLVIERDCDPEDEAALKTLESVAIRLTVIPGKRDRWQEKLAAQTAELMPFWESARHAFSGALSARREQERARFVVAFSSFFEDGKIPAIAENDVTSLLRETAAYERLAQIENDGRGYATGYGFNLSLVPSLLAGFDALATLEAITIPGKL